MPAGLPAPGVPSATGPVAPVQRRPLVTRTTRAREPEATVPGGLRRRPSIGAPLSAGPAPAPVAPVQQATVPPVATPPPVPTAPPAPAPAPAPAPVPTPDPDPVPLARVRVAAPAVQRAAPRGPLASARPLTVSRVAAPAIAPASSAGAGPVRLRQAGHSDRPATSMAPVPLAPAPSRRPGVPAGPARPAAVRQAPVPVPVARALGQAPRSTPVPVVQRNSAPPSPPAPPPPPAQRPAPAPAPAPAGSTGQKQAAAGEPTAQDLDHLARRLIAPLSRLLRAELRGDRERVGRLRD
ncbi:hypothetical protein [Streptomyces yaizuensis]|uniref:Extensin n=1 Tax=Streptomyces yaizuensis TaxID=2989713 RepID=A0ABQ5P2K4_9ACTN|nr:hypothetical protein [Streptomyces sp. YSPA8]GLF96829.1 hypothetical protein SYYSPA8_21050 [Streptomyces sp. YSPA8]